MDCFRPRREVAVHHVLPEWYSPEQETVRTILTEGTIALDANVLLDLYRLGAEERQQILDIFTKGGVRERLWLPYQAAFEYQKNRVKVATDHVKQFDDINDALTKSEASVLSAVNKLRDKSVKDKLTRIVRESLPASIALITEEIEKLKSSNTISLEHYASDDEIRTKIDALFIDEGQVGPKPNNEVLAERMSTVDKRYDDKVPPGYKDASKPEGREGDLLVWYEILAYADQSDRPLLFVTSDTKEDWYERVGGKTAGPRRELRVEMMKKSTKPYHQVSLNRFLELANEHLSANVEIDTILVVDEISERRRAESMLLSKLRHPSNVVAIDSALATLQPGTSSYQHLIRARQMLNGERSFDEDDANSALIILRQISVDRHKRANRDSREQLTAKRANQIREMLIRHPRESVMFLDPNSGKLNEILEMADNDPEIITLLSEELARIESESRFGNRRERTIREDDRFNKEERFEADKSDD